MFSGLKGGFFNNPPKITPKPTSKAQSSSSSSSNPSESTSTSSIAKITLTSSTANSEKISITHVSQYHPKVIQEKGKYVTEKYNQNNPSHRDVLDSQFRTAQEILKRPANTLVFVEGLDMDSQNSAFYNDDVSVTIEILFPKGFPKSLNEFNEAQKMLLFRYGAPLVLYYLKLCANIYRKINNINDYFSEKDNFSVEKITLQIVKETIANERKKGVKVDEVYCVFGGVHNFADTIQKLKDDSLVFNRRIGTIVCKTQINGVTIGTALI